MNPSVSSLNLSRHALIRTQQRGVSQRALELLFDNYDREADVGRGAVYIYTSKKHIAFLQRLGLTVRECEILRRISAVMDPIRGVIITVIKGAARRLKLYRNHRAHGRPARKSRS